MTGQLFLSFWDICLENLPAGGFSHRQMTGEEARALIERTRRQGSPVVCVSNDDLLAPYKKREVQKHQDLCTALKEHFSILLSLSDFIVPDEQEGQTLSSIIPLQCVQIQEDDRLLVITCAYTLPEKSGSTSLNFRVAPETVEFHLIEATP